MLYDCLWVLYVAWITGLLSDNDMNFNYTTDMVSYYPWFLRKRAWTMYLISGVVVQEWWYMYRYAISLFYDCYTRNGLHLTELNHLQTTTQPPIASNTCSTVTLLGVGKKSLNNIPHQWCSDPMRMIHVWICYSTVLLVLYEAWIISDRGETPHRPQYDIQLYPGHAQLLTWPSEKRAWTMYLISGVVVQGKSYMYGCAILLFYEWYMRHGLLHSCQTTA